MYSFSSINKYRSFLFGIAALWIAWFHSSELVFLGIKGLSYFNIGNFISWIQLMGNCGVDIFLLLSGSGLYFSFQKQPDLTSFWRKRLLRILPSSVIVVIAVACFSHFTSAWSVIARITFLDFFVIKTQGLTFWFIPAILSLYLLFPLFFHLIRRYRLWGLTLIIVVSVAVTVTLFFIAPEMFSQWELLLTRIPVFAAGIVLGQAIEKDVKISNAKALIICIIGILYFTGMIMAISYIPDNYSFLKHYLYLPFAVLLIIIFSFVRSHISAAFLVKPWEFLGMYSLEFYLIHQSLYNGLNGRIKLFENHRLIYDITVIAVTLILSVILKYVVNLFLKLIKRSKRKLPANNAEVIKPGD